MYEKERLVYETFGGRDTIIKNYMKLYDSSGNFLNAYGVAGMCVDGKSPLEYNQIIDASEDWRQKMFDMVKREFIQENGVANGDTTKRTSLYTAYQKSIKIDDRLKGILRSLCNFQETAWQLLWKARRADGARK